MLGRMFAIGAVLLVGCGKVSPVRTVDIRVPSREVDSEDCSLRTI